MTEFFQRPESHMDKQSQQQRDEQEHCGRHTSQHDRLRYDHAASSRVMLAYSQFWPEEKPHWWRTQMHDPATRGLRICWRGR